jgi:hypothetical protein
MVLSGTNLHLERNYNAIWTRLERNYDAFSTHSECISGVHGE